MHRLKTHYERRRLGNSGTGVVYMYLPERDRDHRLDVLHRQVPEEGLDLDLAGECGREAGPASEAGRGRHDGRGLGAVRRHEHARQQRQEFGPPRVGDREALDLRDHVHVGGNMQVDDLGRGGGQLRVDGLMQARINGHVDGPQVGHERFGLV